MGRKKNASCIFMAQRPCSINVCFVSELFHTYTFLLSYKYYVCGCLWLVFHLLRGLARNFKDDLSSCFSDWFWAQKRNYHGSPSQQSTSTVSVGAADVELVVWIPSLDLQKMKRSIGILRGTLFESKPPTQTTNQSLVEKSKVDTIYNIHIYLGIESTGWITIFHGDNSKTPTTAGSFIVVGLTGHHHGL